jgi:hypothetical protein
MTDKEKVVFLAFDNPKLKPETLEVMACVICRNKTFSVWYGENKFPMLKCCVCGADVGRIGWTQE